MAVTVHASRRRPAPAAIPIAADSQMAAAVVSPCTDPRRKMMMPAPRKPMPETIWAATRDGSTSTVPGTRTSLNPYLLTSRISAAAVPTMVCVRIPALLPCSSRSRPMSAVSPNATNSSTIWRTPCPGPPKKGGSAASQRSMRTKLTPVSPLRVLARRACGRKLAASTSVCWVLARTMLLPALVRWEPQLNDYDRQQHLSTLLQFALRVVIVVFAAGTLVGEPANRPYVDLCGYLGALCRDRRFLERVGATGRITGGDRR